MAIRIVSQSGQISYGIVEFALDTPADLPNLPTYPLQGSIARIISNGDEYMLNSDKLWVKQPASAGGGGTGDVTQDDITITQTQGTAVAVGGLPAGSNITNLTTKEVLERILYPYQGPSVTLATTPATTIYDAVTGSIPSIVLTATVTKRTNPVTSVVFYAGATAINTVAQDVSNGGTFTYTYTPGTPITSNITFRVVASDGTSSPAATKDIVFIGQTYYGIVGPDVIIPTADEVKALNKTLKNTNDYTYNNITTDFEKIVYAYPASLGALTSIVDANNIAYLNSYTRQNLTIDGIAYYVYILTNASAVTGFTQKYS